MDPRYVGGEIGQGHLFLGALADKPKQRAALLAQLEQLEHAYPGGLTAYVDRARELLDASRVGANPFRGYTPSVPQGERLAVATSQFEEMEALGLEQVARCAFVLVAGGLGERLGYSGIKLELPAELLTSKCFLQSYVESILALQARARASSGDAELQLGLVIMTSDDTHERTVELLHKFAMFGAAEGQIALLKQEKVPALVDNAARFAQDPETGLVETKPHGHGDVHALLHMSGVLEAWAEGGVEWIVFFQDTNALVFRAVVAALGVSAARGFDVNSIAVPRRPGEPVGSICRLTREDGSALTVNVEYNQLDPMLRAAGHEAGDRADETGFSPFPGNINVLVLRCAPYAATLKRTGGHVPEFINPKYADEARTVFKKPARLESMMQDYPRLLAGSDAKVGFTQLERFICFSAVKNSAEEALAKLKATGFAESAASGEADVYATNRLLLALAGVQVRTAGGKSTAWLGIPVPNLARVVLAPSFAATVAELRARFPTPDKVSISDRSSLVLEGDVVVEKLALDGDLRVSAMPGARIVIRNLAVKNDGVTMVPVDKDAPEVLKMRGYRKKEAESLIIHQTEPGETIIDRGLS